MSLPYKCIKFFICWVIRLYVKLQDAYVAENGTHVGSWFDIGYLMNNSSNFYYCNTASGACTAANNTDGYSGTKTTNSTPDNYVASWTATNIATLNDCAANSTWNLTTSQNGSEGGIVLYAATVTGGDNKSCDILTPNFKKLNTKTSTN